MEVLLSNFAPGKFDNNRSSKDVFEICLQESDFIKIATGYISAESLIELKKIVELNKRPHINLMIGMHKFDGFTKIQYDAALALNEFLVSSNMGFVSISDTLKFHGKMYSFSKEGKPFGSIIGSSNLGSVITSGDKSRIYEVDCYFNELIQTKEIDKTISDLIKKISLKIDKVNIETFKEFNNLLENQEGVEKIDQVQFSKYWGSKSNLNFEIPIKTKPKSSLNIFFGKGRVSQKNFEIPRHWYEAELIVSKTITQIYGYPKNKSFTVITDDGWKFECETNGDWAKNFRSKKDLQIFGRWIKGRLENYGALKIGEPVNDKVLDKYGTNFMSLFSTANDSIWLIEFKPK